MTSPLWQHVLAVAILCYVTQTPHANGRSVLAANNVPDMSAFYKRYFQTQMPPMKRKFWKFDKNKLGFLGQMEKRRQRCLPVALSRLRIARLCYDYDRF